MAKLQINNEKQNNEHQNSGFTNKKPIHILLFYKFQKIKNPEYFSRKQKNFCKKLGVLGKILVAKEGINGSISGTKEQVENYKKFLKTQKGFEDVSFKEEVAFEHPFTRMHVRIRNEIVSLKKKINIKNKGKYITPKEFLKIYENEIISTNKKVLAAKSPKKNSINNKKIIERMDLQFGENYPANKSTQNKKLSITKITNNKLKNNKKKNNEVIILDTRNYYEYNLGRFKDAIHGNIKTFREFPKFIERFNKNFTKEEIKNKKIILYCTGGIRCEKASAYMKEKGFENVFQLEGGIINFCQQFPNTTWEGKCFVFDKRLMTDLNQNNKPITKCINCKELCDLYRNCKNLKCDKLVISCLKCQEKLQGCCSKKCLKDFLKYSRERALLKKQGNWKPKIIFQNYVK